MENQTMSKQELLDNASDIYEIAEVTQGMNGYPQGLGSYGVIGFKTFKDAEEFASKHGLETGLFKKRDGWRFWEYCGVKHGHLTSGDYLYDLGDNWEEYMPDDEVFRDRLKDLAEREVPFKEIERFVNQESSLRSEYDAIDNESEALIVKDNVESEVVDIFMMSYHEDVWHWAVGVFVPSDFGDDDE